MLNNKLAHKTVFSTRTYQYRIYDDLSEPFEKVKMVRKLYYNYGLKYLYQHYGIGHIKQKLPSGRGKQYLIKDMKAFARKKAESHHLDLKAMDYSIQSIDKMYEELLVAFEQYKRKQYGVLHWSNKKKNYYLNRHNCALSGFGRISYKRDHTEFRSATFKSNGGVSNKLINSYIMKIPYFGKVHTKRSLNHLKGKKILETRIIRRPNGDFVLQVVTKLEKKKNLTENDLKNIVGMDVNEADNKFFQVSAPMTPEEQTWDKHTHDEFVRLSNKADQIQNYLTSKHHRFDNSRKTKELKRRLARLRAKAAHLIDAWQLRMAKYFCKKYPVMAIEQLNSFTMRISKRDKRYFLRKNHNHKLATIQPTTFRKMMEYIYEDAGHLLLEVDSYYTSKVCHYCGMVNKDLKPGEKHWICPNCGKLIDRDYNAALNIRDWAEDIMKHPKYAMVDDNGQKFLADQLLLVF